MYRNARKLSRRNFSSFQFSGTVNHFFYNLVAILLYFVLNIAFTIQCKSLLSLPCSVPKWLSPSLLNYVILPHSTQSTEMSLWNCATVPQPYWFMVCNHTSTRLIARYLLRSHDAQCDPLWIRDSHWASASSSAVPSLLPSSTSSSSLSTGSPGLDELLLCKFHRWRNCWLVNWNGILNSVFIDHGCHGR